MVATLGAVQAGTHLEFARVLSFGKRLEKESRDAHQSLWPEARSPASQPTRIPEARRMGRPRYRPTDDEAEADTRSHRAANARQEDRRSGVRPGAPDVDAVRHRVPDLPAARAKRS